MSSLLIKYCACCFVFLVDGPFRFQIVPDLGVDVQVDDHARLVFRESEEAYA